MSKKCCGDCQYYDDSINRCKLHDGMPEYKQVIYDFFDACEDFKE